MLHNLSRVSRIRPLGRLQATPIRAQRLILATEQESSRAHAVKRQKTEVAPDSMAETSTSEPYMPQLLSVAPM